MHLIENESIREERVVNRNQSRTAGSALAALLVVGVLGETASTSASAQDHNVHAGQFCQPMIGFQACFIDALESRVYKANLNDYMAPVTDTMR